LLGCCHNVTLSALQLVAVKQELAVRVSELTHVSTSLQEHKDSLAHTRSQLATVQDNLGGQLRALQRELSATQAEKLQSDREVGRLQQEGGRYCTMPQF
jgi:septal ring factor EnvC (AmiA/AmiB activator)